jgi:hypothetical protein
MTGLGLKGMTRVCDGVCIGVLIPPILQPSVQATTPPPPLSPTYVYHQLNLSTYNGYTLLEL